MKQIIAVIFLVFAVIMGMNCITYFDPNNQAGIINQGSDSISSIDSASDEIIEYITVNVTGEVEKPGSYEVENGTFLDDLIAQAGGITEKADETCFDYYLILNDNLNIYIPPITGDKKISINSSTSEELSSLTGIGTTLANNIVSYRMENGDFLYLEQIMEVKGIGKSIFFKIRDFICL